MTGKEVLTICKELYADKNASLTSAKEGQDKCDEDTKYIWNGEIDYLQRQVDFYECMIQELEVLEIIKTKKVDMNHLWSLFKWDDDESALAEYNKYNVDQYELTEAEFKLLKDLL